MLIQKAEERNMFLRGCAIAIQQSGGAADSALQALLVLNQQFAHPLSDAEVRDVVAAVFRTEVMPC